MVPLPVEHLQRKLLQLVRSLENLANMRDSPFLALRGLRRGLLFVLARLATRSFQLVDADDHTCRGYGDDGDGGDRDDGDDVDDDGDDGDGDGAHTWRGAR